ncbi:hypothetical protein HanPSC8_Chr11g0453791 [Helianthus annuus]|nr:hypothetical protein HanPSC8_Chr11g0453791 [Helianthus annuus]
MNMIEEAVPLERLLLERDHMRRKSEGLRSSSCHWNYQRVH